MRETLDLAVEGGYKGHGLTGVQHVDDPKPRKYSPERLIVDTLRANDARLLLNIPCLLYKQKIDFNELYILAEGDNKLAQLGTLLNISAKVLPRDYKQRDYLAVVLNDLRVMKFPEQYLFDDKEGMQEISFGDVPPNNFNVKTKLDLYKFKQFFERHLYE